MLLIDNQNISDPTVNLALEEHCYRNLDTLNDYILFYINKPSIIFGNHQNPFQEFNCNFAEQKKIRPLRRISGGGTVYHDSGNLNYSFITAFTEEKLGRARELIQPIMNTLWHMGVPAELTEKNAILINGQKISGNSQHTNMVRLLTHGTLLFNSDLDVLNEVLISNLNVVKSRAVQSIRSDIANIEQFLPHPIGMESFLAALKTAASDAFGNIKKYRLSEKEWDNVHRLAEEKYESWEWTFGRSPEFTARHKITLDTFDVDVHVNVRNGIIREIATTGNYDEKEIFQKYFAELIGMRYGSEHATQLLK
jgi:lipoate-protein ligase A